MAINTNRTLIVTNAAFNTFSTTGGAFITRSYITVGNYKTISSTPTECLISRPGLTPGVYHDLIGELLIYSQVLAELCDIIRVSSDHTNTLQPGEMANSWLPKTILYDDCYHVVKHIIDYFPKNFRQTPASTFLYHSSFAIDAYHYRNHTDKWCQQYLNPNENEVVKRFNTQSAEQSNSWIKRFSKQFSRFDDEHCAFFSP
ncbi:unnamed protein product [Rotaria magnacalcarata]